MCAVDHAHSFGYVFDVIDEDRAFFCQLVHYETVVHDFFADVDRRAKSVERNIHYVDGPYYSGAEAARFKKQNPFAR